MGTDVNGLRVLVAESNPAYMAALRQTLASSSRVAAAVETAQGGRVVEDVQRMRPDVALLDVHLPGRGGLAVARELREKAPGVKIILLLSDDGLAYRMAASEIGARWVAKDRLVEELSALLDAAAVARNGWTVAGGRESVDRVHVDVTYGSARGARATFVAAQDWRAELARAIRPALAIFLIGMVLLGLTAAIAWNPYAPVVRDSGGGSRIVDDLGLFGQRGAIVLLSSDQTDAYVAAQREQHQRNLLLCVTIGALGLAVGSVLIAWNEILDSSRKATRGGFPRAS